MKRRKKTRSKSKVRVVYVKRGRKMARKRSYSRARRYYSRARGGVKGMLPPIVGGIADAVINPRIPINGVGSVAVGYIMHDSTLKTLGLYQVGQSIAGFIPFIGAGSGGFGGSQV